MSPGPVPPPDAPGFARMPMAGVLVATDEDDAVAGYVFLRQELPLPAHAHVLDIAGLAVDPARQGRGIGRLLLDAAAVEARARGATKLALRVLATNPGAQRLYAACGFAVEGVLRDEFVIGGVAVDDVLMARML